MAWFKIKCVYLQLRYNRILKKSHDMEKMTKEQAYQWLREVKQNKKRTLDRMTDWLVKDYEKRTGQKPTYIETL